MAWTTNDETDRVSNDGVSGTVVDAVLFKAISLYLRLLRPAGSGGVGRLVRTAYVFALCLTVGVQLVQIVGLYRVLNDSQRFIYSSAVIFYRLTGSYMGYVMLANADRLWTVLDAARTGFTSLGRRNPSAVYRCDSAATKLLLAYATLSTATVIAWCTVPLPADGRPVSGLGPGDTVVGDQSAANLLWFPVAESAYGLTPVRVSVNALHVFVTAANAFAYGMFDCYLVTVCVALDAQFRTLVSGYQTVTDLHSHSRHSGISTESDANKSDCHDDLISHLEDNKKIITKFDEFFDVVRFPVMVLIVNCSNAMLVLSYLIAMLYVSGWSIISASVLKYIIGFMTVTVELYLYCYGFKHMGDVTSDINFGLYCSNWMEMDLKFQNTLMLAMNMNSSHMRTMKVTPRSVVNLEMFTSVFSMSYTIVSIILNVA